MASTVTKQSMDDFWEFILNEIQNWSFRFEDILLHSLSGIFFAVSFKIRKIIKKIKSYF